MSSHSADHNTAELRQRLMIVIVVVLLVCISLVAPPDFRWLAPALLVLLFSALDTLMPFHIRNHETGLRQVVLIGAVLLFGASLMVWAGFIGAWLGYRLRVFFHARYKHSIPVALPWRQALSAAGLPVIAVSISLLTTCLAANPDICRGAAVFPVQNWHSYLLPLTLFILLQTSLLWLAHKELPAPGKAKAQLGLWFFWLLVELIPMPFVLAAVLIYPPVGQAVFVLLVMGAMLAAFLLHIVEISQQKMRHSMKELATLNKVSQALRTSLELDNLLAALQLQVRQLLGVDNFYVALYDPQLQQIWYPMAVKRGVLVNWSPRALMHRLTDRVIQERQPVLIPRQAQQELERIGLPVGEDVPYAWMGVPLIAAGRTIGCLAVFSFSPQSDFNTANLFVLETLSGQVSVAVENTFLHQQARQSLARLESMNQIATLVSGSQNPQDVLMQVCHSAVEMTGGAPCVIYLVDQNQNGLQVACAEGFSNAFLKRFHHFSAALALHMRSLTEAKPFLINDLSTMNVDTDATYQEALREEGIHAWGDFPLVTPQGLVGCLSVYFRRHYELNTGEKNFLQTLAAQAALAISSARLHAQSDQALRRRAEQLAVLEAMERELAAATHSEGLFELILMDAITYSHSQRGVLIASPAQDSEPEIKAACGCLEPALARLKTHTMYTRAQEMVSPETCLHSNSLLTTQEQPVSQLWVPLVYHQQWMGMLLLESDLPDAYNAGDLGFVGQLANQAAISLANAGLYHEVARIRDRLATLVQSMDEGLLMADQSGTILLVNPFLERVTGLLHNQLVGKHLADLPAENLALLGLSPEDVMLLLNAMNHHQQAEFSVQEYSLPDASRVLQRHMQIIPGEAGCLVSLHDITADQSLAQARELLTETLVHDLRSPMASVIGALEVIAGNRQGDHDLNLRAVDIAQRGAQRVLRLVDSVLDISRMEAGEMEIRMERLSLAELVNEALAEFQRRFQEARIQAHIILAPNLPEINADRTKLFRVIGNLLDNALKFTPPGGIVELSARQVKPAEIEVWVCDTGPGVPIEYRQQIFERFCQAPGQEGRKQGSGLGLTFCKLAVEAHGGRIWSDQAPGGGCAFVFTLPV